MVWYKSVVWYARKGRAPEQTNIEPNACLSDCPGNSPDAPGHALCARDSLRLTNFANAHLCSPPARHLEDVSIRRGHFKDAVLMAKNFGRIQNFNCAVDRLAHGASICELLRCGDAINGQYRFDYNTNFYVFLTIENKRVILSLPRRRQKTVSARPYLPPAVDYILVENLRLRPHSACKTPYLHSASAHKSQQKSQRIGSKAPALPRL